MAAISQRTMDLASGLMDPLRLRVLIALEDRPSTATQLSRALDAPYDKVNWAVKQLVKGDLAELRAVEPGASGMVMQKVYAARHRGWAALVPVLETIARSGERQAS